MRDVVLSYSEMAARSRNERGQITGSVGLLGGRACHWRIRRAMCDFDITISLPSFRRDLALSHPSSAMVNGVLLFFAESTIPAAADWVLRSCRRFSAVWSGVLESMHPRVALLVTCEV